MTLNERIARFVNLLLREKRLTQEGLSTLLEVTPASLRRYIETVSVPSLQTMIRMAKVSGVSIDEIVSNDHVEIPPQEGDELSKPVRKRASGSLYRTALTPEQYHRLKDLIDQIVHVHQQTMEKPHTYGSLWNSLCRRFEIQDPSEITQGDFRSAETYLLHTLNRLKGRSETDADDTREVQLNELYSTARKNQRWTKSATDAFIRSKYNKASIRDLSEEELRDLKEIVSETKKMRSRRKHGQADQND